MPLKFLCSIFALLAFSLFSETPQDGKALLSSHETLAKFQGVQKRKCLGRTSLCPDRCGHSGAVAHFKIIKYLSYNKLGKYGDAKGSSFQTLLTKIQDPLLIRALECNFSQANTNTHICKQTCWCNLDFREKKTNVSS